MDIKHKIQMYKEFGFKAAFSSACSSAFRRPMSITRWKDRCILDWMRKNYSSVIEKYRHRIYDTVENLDSNAPVWSVWWQGEDNAPEVVKMCFAGVNARRGAHPFRIITKDNFREYIDIPEHITRKVQNKTISLTHFSDILRVYLLYHYGGLWMDATVLAVDDIPEEIFRHEFFSIKSGFNPKSFSVPMGRWTSFFQAAHKGSMLCGFALDFHIEYWKEHNMPVDYILIDYIYALAYEEYPECRELLDSVPVNNKDIERLMPLLNQRWDSGKFEELSASTRFFKLSHKHSFVKAVSGQETFYGHLVSCGG